MKKSIAFIVILSFLTPLTAQSIIYVKQGSNGRSGTSWKDAFGDLQLALRNAQAGQEIWVAAGTYYPGNDRKATFRIRNDIRMYGGFRGTERKRQERNIYRNHTILSGDIGQQDQNFDNCYTIIYTNHVSSRTVVDGFVISGALSDGTADLGHIERSGGAWFNDASRGESSPMIVNCLFINNYAKEGAALYNFANGADCQPRIINCQFIKNSASFEGGAIFNDGRNGNASPRIEDCNFLENSADYGGAIRNLAGKGKAVPTISRSVFESNVAFARKIIYNGTSATDNCRAIIEDSFFFDNGVSMGRSGNNVTQLAKKREGYLMWFPDEN